MSLSVRSLVLGVGAAATAVLVGVPTTGASVVPAARTTVLAGYHHHDHDESDSHNHFDHNQVRNSGNRYGDSGLIVLHNLLTL